MSLSGWAGFSTKSMALMAKYDRGVNPIAPSAADKE